MTTPTIGAIMIAGPNGCRYGPKLRQRLWDFSSQRKEELVDAGLQVRYIEETLRWKPVAWETLVKCSNRYKARFGVSAHNAMWKYFNPKGTDARTLPQHVRDLWYFTMVGDLIDRGGYEAP